jgi:PAS domain S-box-containing protein
LCGPSPFRDNIRAFAKAGDEAMANPTQQEAEARLRASEASLAALHEREREIGRLSRLYEALRHINQAISCTPTRVQLFQKICEALVELGGFRMSWIGWHSPESHMIVPLASYGDENGYLNTIHVRSDDSPEGRGPTGTAFREQCPYICNDVASDPRTLPWRSEMERRGFRASAALPIREAGRVVGTLSVHAAESGYFRDQEVALIKEAASDISFALDNIARDEARRLAEKSLRQERDFSDVVLASLPGVFYLYDETGKFLRWNRNFERVTGYGGEEIAAMHPLQFFRPAEQELLTARIGEVFTRGESSVEAEFLCKDGQSKPYHFTGVRAEIDGKTCLVGVGIDIGARVAAQAALADSEARYRTLFEQAPDGILIADSRSYYIDANPSICQMLGYTRAELIRLHASDIVIQEQLPQVDVALDVIHGGGEFRQELRFRRKDGSTFAAEVLATQMPDGNLVGMIRDVTQRKQAERALRELNETLEQKVSERTGELHQALGRAEAADRVKSAFLATMSHELRTPLNSIIGFTGIVLQGLAGPLNPEQTKQLGMVRSSARHLLELINDVLDLSKIEAEQLEVRVEPFEPSSSIEKVIASVRPLAEKKGIALTASLPESLGQLASDRRRFEQILINLVNNAIKFTERGSVTLEAELQSSVCVGAVPAPRAALRVRVSDTGIGIRPEHLSKLFQPFSQVDTGISRQHEGTGLGLAICRRLATLLGGEIDASSEWSKGSTFTVMFPLEGPTT